MHVPGVPGDGPPVVMSAAGAPGGSSDQRQGVFIGGGSVEGSVVGINHGAVNQYTQVTVAPGGTLLNAAPPPTIQRLPTVPQPPRPLRGFLDRDEALRTLQPECRPGGAVWVHGAAGCGCSALLRQATTVLDTSTLPDGVIMLNGLLEPTHFNDIVQGLFHRFYSSTTTVHLAPETARTFLETLHALVVCDRLLLGQRELVELADVFRSGSVWCTAEGNASDIFLDVTLHGLPRQDGIQLCARAAQCDPTEAITASILGDISDVLHGLPLPLVLAGRLVAQDMIDLPHLLERLQQVSGEPLEQVLQAVLSLLSEPEQNMLAALVQAGGPSVSMESLPYLSEMSDDTVQQVLERLTSLGLVEQSGQRASIVSASVSQVLRRLLRPGPERMRAVALFASGGLAARARGDMHWLEQEQGNVMAALETLQAEGHAAHAASLAVAVQPMVTLRGMWDVWQQVITIADKAARTTSDDLLQGWSLHEHGTRAGVLGDIATARAALHAALDVRRAIGDTVGAAATEHNMRYLGIGVPPPDAATPATTRAATRGAGFPVIAIVVVLVLLSGIGGVLALVAGTGLFSANPTATPTPVTLAPPSSGPAHTGTRTPTLTPRPRTPTTVPMTPTLVTVTPTLTATATPRPTPSVVVEEETATPTLTPVPTVTPTPTPLATGTPTPTPLPTIPPTPTPSPTIPPTPTPSPTMTPTPSPTVTPTPTPTNSPPTANQDTATTLEQEAVTLDVLANDTDTDGSLDAGSLALETEAAHGTVTVGDGMLTYTPAPQFVGSDTMTYRVCDDGGACASAAVVIQVLASQPDLVITTFAQTGTPRNDGQNNVLIPVQVVVTNQGTASAETFKVSVSSTSSRGTSVVAFTVRGSDSAFYPSTTAPLASDDAVTFDGFVTVPESVMRSGTTLEALADSCSGDEFMPPSCRVEESDEQNNTATLVP